MASEIENHFTVFIRLPFNRGDFVDPPPVAWSAAKERDLWEIISRQSKGHEIDWRGLADQFRVTQPFLLQQAAWLYERQLSQVRAQMRRMGARQSAAPSPVPPSSSSSTTASAVNAQAAKKLGAIPSRTPSRPSTQGAATSSAQDPNTRSTPGRSRFSISNRSSTATATVNAPARPTTTKRASKEADISSRAQSRRGSLQNQIVKEPQEFTKSPVADTEQPQELPIDDAASSAPGAKAITHRKSNPAVIHRRTPSLRKSQHIRQQSIGHVDEETEDEDPPAFLPLDKPASKDQSAASSQDPSATLRGGFHQSPPRRPETNRRSTSERVRHASTTAAMRAAVEDQNMTSSTSSNDALALPPRQPTSFHRHSAARTSAQAQAQAQAQANLPTPLSPTQQAALAQAGLSPRSPRRRPHHGHTGSESSPSMGSSFSDLDDASVTQSALEEALMSGMGSVATTAGGTGTLGVGGLGSRVSGISQALRSRYFDARHER